MNKSAKINYRANKRDEMSNQEAEFYSREMVKYRDRCEELENKLNNPLCTSFLYESRINELKKMCQKLYNALNCAHGYIDPYENKRTDKICMEALCEYEKVKDGL